MSEFNVRIGTPDDYDYLQELGYATVDSSISPQRPAPHDAVVASIDKLLAYVLNVNHTALIAEHNNKRIGFLLMLDTLPDEVSGIPQMFVAYMAVDERFRGRGVGRLMLQAAEDEARARGLPHISLMVTDANNAVGFYEKLGYDTERRLLCKTL